MIALVDRNDLVAFASRDWSQIAEAKSEFWRSRRRNLTPTEILAIGDQLRRHVLALRPDWPSDTDRATDIAAHLRVTEALRAVPSRPR